MKKIHKIILGVILVSQSFGSTPCQASVPAQTWSMKQDSDRYGPVSTYMCNDGVRMDTEEFIVLITATPVYEITIYNRDSKGFLKKKITDLKPLKTAAEVKKAGWKVTKGKTETIGGVKAVQYIFNKHPKNKYEAVTELWATTDLGTIKSLNEACLRFMCMDDIGSGYGMPVKLFRCQTSGKKYVYYDTSDIKATPPVAAFIKLPEEKGVHQVYNLVDLMGKDSPMDLPIRE